jgi:hypothetical protein
VLVGELLVGGAGRIRFCNFGLYVVPLYDFTFSAVCMRKSLIIQAL